MRPLVRIVTYCAVIIASFVCIAIGTASLFKYRNDKDLYDEIVSYIVPANCTVIGIASLSSDPLCPVWRYRMNLTIDGMKLPGYYLAVSGFFADACGGVFINETGTVLPCFYKDLSNPTVRITAVNAFLPDDMFKRVGYALVILGCIGPGMVLILCCCTTVFRCLRWWTAPRHATQSAAGLQRAPERSHNSPTNANASGATAVPLSVAGDDPWICPEVVHSTVDTSWNGRLVTKSEFAVEAAARLAVTSSQLLSQEECPLCFKPFGAAAVWWTCGHLVCEECSPRIMILERSFGRRLTPQCPLCRTKSELELIVRLRLDGQLNQLPTSSSMPLDPTLSDVELEDVFDSGEVASGAGVVVRQLTLPSLAELQGGAVSILPPTAGVLVHEA